MHKKAHHLLDVRFVVGEEDEQDWRLELQILPAPQLPEERLLPPLRPPQDVCWLLPRPCIRRLQQWAGRGTGTVPSATAGPTTSPNARPASGAARSRRIPPRFAGSTTPGLTAVAEAIAPEEGFAPAGNQGIGFAPGWIATSTTSRAGWNASGAALPGTDRCSERG
ncbi:hypothetical protein MLD38_030679 [Melastoma candidum]|uniref:Uncharacterized protein n=1 Tax=Melastoma candidum TaxID=119954 RepID=A0ACB9MSJ5_9MYRT|nr:hypothetical protein MLD38_030679 [Melastoma candidum]